MAQKVLGAYVGQSSGSLSYPTNQPTLAPSPQKNLGGQNFLGHFLIFHPTKLKLVILEIEIFLKSQN